MEPTERWKISKRSSRKPSEAEYYSPIRISPKNEESGKVNITGDISLKLKNALKKGELIDLNWRKLQTNTQELKARFNYPFLFNSALGLDVKTKLYRRDTSFSETNGNVAVQYLIGGGNYFQVYYSGKSANTITQTNSSLGNTTARSFGVGFIKNKIKG